MNTAQLLSHRVMLIGVSHLASIHHIAVFLHSLSM